MYTAGVKYQGFSKLVLYRGSQQFSVSERTAGRIIKENKADWVKHNMAHISRVYPRAVRLNSTNYDPVPCWAAGCQIVALNWQTLDEGMVLNNALFADSRGYVLKPPALRQKLSESTNRYRLRIQVISAQRLPLSSDLYVQGCLSSETSEAHPYPHRRTSAIKHKSLNPVWDEPLTFEFNTTPSMLELTFVHLEIRNRNLVAQWVRPVSTAPRGYHHLPLYDPLFSRYVFATLFVRIDVDILHTVRS